MSDPMKSPDRDAADDLLQNLTKRKTMEAPFARYCWQNSAQIIEALSELATLRRRVALLEGELSHAIGTIDDCAAMPVDTQRYKAVLPPGRNEG